MTTCMQRALFCAAALLPFSAISAEPDPTLTDLLRAQLSTLEVRDGQLLGDGAPALIAAANKAQFVLIGEDHGFADVPQFAAALQRGMGAGAPEHLVVEVGPYSTARIESALRQGRSQLTDLNRAYPSAFPFLNLREDGDLAALFVDPDDVDSRLWGIDQEFVLSPSLHLETLASALTDAQSRKQMSAYTDRAQQAYTRMVEHHDPSSMPLLKFTSTDFEAMTALFPKQGAGESLALINALALSAEIYRDQNTAPFASNLRRSQLMKQNFMNYYRQAGASVTVRAMFKMGAFHAGRGRSLVNLYDIGNLASELAESNGSNSLHVLVLCAGGTVNQWRPFIADESARTRTYVAAEELSILGVEPFLEAADPKSWSIIDVSAIREERLPKSTRPRTRDLIFNYDRVVIIPEATAAIDDL